MLKKSGHEVSVTLPSDRQIAFTRIFDWPPHLLFEAWTRPQHLRNWWGCGGSSLIVCEIDLRPGGAWRFVVRMSDGSEHVFKGVYREIVPDVRLIYTECYDMPSIGSPEWLTTINFDAFEGGTRLTHLILHKSTEARDGHLQAGMEAGMVDSLSRLEREVASMSTHLVSQHDQ